MKPHKLLLLGIHFSLSVGFYAKAESERAGWLAEKRQAVEEARANPNTESIEKLGAMVRGLARQKSDLDTDGEKILNDAKDVLLSIPGHAEYFGDRIKATADAQIAGTGTPRGVRREWDFETLTQLQSPETVKVLGELLFDERDPFKDIHDDAGWRPNCMFAEGSLYKLGLNNPPVNGPYIKYEEDLHTWQLWYQQVRAGTRTFSFKGDDKVYTLAGPVTGTPQPGSSPPRLATPSIPQAIAVAPQGPKGPFIAAVLVAVGAGLAVFWRAKNRRA